MKNDFIILLALSIGVYSINDVGCTKPKKENSSKEEVIWSVDDGAGLKPLEGKLDLTNAGYFELSSNGLIVDDRVYKGWNNAATIKQINKTVDSIYRLKSKK